MCESCREHIFEPNTEISFCLFCGMNTCETCLYKERMFPRAKLNADAQKPRGAICKLCDRKFIIRSLTSDTAASTRKSQNKVSSLENELKIV